MESEHAVVFGKSALALAQPDVVAHRGNLWREIRGLISKLCDGPEIVRCIDAVVEAKGLPPLTEGSGGLQDARSLLEVSGWDRRSRMR